MKYNGTFLAAAVVAFAVSALRLGLPAKVEAQHSLGSETTVVHSQFGGQIFGFDIDQNGTEGVLSESQDIGGGRVLAAVETFDQTTGAILKVVKKLQTKDDFVTLGIGGAAVGLVEREHVKGIYVVKRIYEELSPVNKNNFTGTWNAPLASNDIIEGFSQNQGAGGGTFTNAVLAFQNGGNNNTFVFGTNVNTKTFGKQITLTDPVFSISPVMAYDAKTNQAVIAAATGAVGGPAPQIALVDLTKGTVKEFTGILGPPPFHQGYVNGIAVDSEDGIACTTTELDAQVEFYDLNKQTGFAVPLPGNAGQLQSGQNLEYDPINKLFLVAQPFSSTGPGSSIQVYDINGNLVESLNGFNFPISTGAMFQIHPSQRSGFVYGTGLAELDLFTY